jgi:hypothetical protein
MQAQSALHTIFLFCSIGESDVSRCSTATLKGPLAAMVIFTGHVLSLRFAYDPAFFPSR